MLRPSALAIALFALWAAFLAAPEPAQAASRCEYVVKKGDTLAQIARRKRTTTDALLQANPKLRKNPHRLRPGQTIRLCTSRSSSRSRGSSQKCGKSGHIVNHTVGDGETLGALAAEYETSVAAIRRSNRKLKKRKNNMIRKGETLRICTSSGPRAKERLVGGVQLPEGTGYIRRRPGNAWGKAAVIHSIVAAIERYHAGTPRAPVVRIGDISRKSGGPLGNHLSHQGGRDIDVGYIFDDGSGRKELDVAHSWALVKAFTEDANLKVIFADYGVQGLLYEHALSIGEDPELLDELFEYPNRGSSNAVIYHWRGHARHFHVRYRRDSSIQDTCTELPGTLVIDREGTWARVVPGGPNGPTLAPARWCSGETPRS
ncbi:MAG: penicillin-insensitive murein endopeptidase [Nannocystaceae bacterium]|nr:penicillin-insensitive murein endopeptidase [bacterium]